MENGPRRSKPSRKAHPNRHRASSQPRSAQQSTRRSAKLQLDARPPHPKPAQAAQQAPNVARCVKHQRIDTRQTQTCRTPSKLRQNEAELAENRLNACRSDQFGNILVRTRPFRSFHGAQGSSATGTRNPAKNANNWPPPGPRNVEQTSSKRRANIEHTPAQPQERRATIEQPSGTTPALDNFYLIRPVWAFFRSFHKSKLLGVIPSFNRAAITFALKPCSQTASGCEPCLEHMFLDATGTFQLKRTPFGTNVQLSIENLPWRTPKAAERTLPSPFGSNFSHLVCERACLLACMPRACLPAHRPTCLPANLPAYLCKCLRKSQLPASAHHLPAFLPACLSVRQCACCLPARTHAACSPAYPSAAPADLRACVPARLHACRILPWLLAC